MASVRPNGLGQAEWPRSGQWKWAGVGSSPLPRPFGSALSSAKQFAELRLNCTGLCLTVVVCTTTLAINIAKSVCRGIHLFKYP
ncbi:hypothetical protein BC936DRAFT_138325 [Jimgerdemannia flammicorona]|uniref:Uncharacterized protein n=1 Tax=Jimgerdemannia flammicorona TaxID=994334 RepID=A0A433CP91_9FUNG|nr:hypothetical protein BC936DRAFT_138325 [Jimgerdemannia flammicorona]